jgi:putative inorganic carbon (hco3(-)) transporter
MIPQLTRGRRWPRPIGMLGKAEAHARPTPVPVIAGLATTLAAFLLYSNLPVVLARDGRLPAAAAGVVPGLLALAVAHRVVIRRRALELDRTFVLMVGFLAVLLASAFAARGYSEAFSRILVFCSEGLLIYVLVRNAVDSSRMLHLAMIGALAAAALLSALSLVQAATENYEQHFLGLAETHLTDPDGPPTLQSAGGERGLANRARGPMDEPNRFAQILLMTLPLAFVFGLNASSRLGAIVAYACVGALIGGVLVTYSRGAFLTLVIMILLLAPLRLMRPGRVLPLLVLGALLAPLVAPGYVERVASISGVAELWGSTSAEADGSTRGRTTEMLAALAAYTDHAVLGVGPGQYLPFYSVEYQALPEISLRELSVPRRAHSLYLEMAAETGTVGLLVFLSIPLLLLRDLRVLRLRLQPVRPDLARWAAGFSLAVLAYLGTGVFLHLAFERYYWFMMGLTAAAVGGLEAERDLEVDSAPTAWTDYRSYGPVTA